MKLNQFSILTATAVLMGTLPVISHAMRPTAEHTPGQVATLEMAQAAQVAIASGTFVAAEQPTTGTARIVQEGGHRYLELDGAFSTSSQGPDLHVLLDTTSNPPASYPNQGRVINLGRLRTYSGAQRYPIPDVINAGNYQSVVIWCRMANATFGYASLQPARRASMQ